MRVFLDTSVVLAACGSGRGVARAVFRCAEANSWILLTAPYVLSEVLVNLPNLPSGATADWARLRPNLTMVDNVLKIDRAAVFEPAKHRPIVFSASAWAEVLLTLD